MKKHFNKNLIMSEEEEQFQLSKTCWICKKRIDDDDMKKLEIMVMCLESLEMQLVGVVT